MNQKYATINVGLNVGDHEPSDQLKKTLNLINPKYYSVVKETYKLNGKDVTERTLVALIPKSTDTYTLVEIATQLQQDAIAVKTGYYGFMIHSPNAKQTWEFNEKYFQYMDQDQFEDLEMYHFIGTLQEMTAEEAIGEIATAGLSDKEIAFCVYQMALNDTFKFKKG